VRRVAAAEVDAAIVLLRSFVPEVSVANWQRVLFGPGAEPPHDIGFGLYAGEELVGFLGAMPSEREIHGRRERICNLHSVFVRPRFAAAGGFLLLAAMDDPEVTLTALTPSPRVRDVLQAAGFVPLETTSRLHLPLPDLHALLGDPPGLLPVTGQEPWLDPARASLLRDHRREGCRGYLIRDREAEAFIVTRRGRLRRLPMLGVSEILHVGGPDVAERHFGWLKLAIMRRERSVVLRCDARLLGGAHRLALSRARPGYFRSHRLRPIDIDNLYSEILYQGVLAARGDDGPGIDGRRR
jgi:hypothetical protein